MSLYVISDLHLSTNEFTGKSMEKFGSRWQNYIEKLKKNWSAIITDDDTVVIPGDISWAMKLEEALSDLLFIDSLPGTKIIGKGNHDFWWATTNKINSFFNANEIKTIKILHNNAYKVDDFIICGSRGWFYDEKQQNTVGTVDYSKIIAREVRRLETSINAAIELQKSEFEEGGKYLPILCFLHFPPIYGDMICEEITDTLKKYSIKTCFYGHIHGNYMIPRSFEYDGTTYIMIAADYLNFCPMPVFI